MKRNKLIVSILILIAAVLYLPAISQPYNTVPVDDPVYVLLENLELRGLISPLSGVKPYTRTFVAAQLDSALTSPNLTAGEQETVRFYRSRFTSPGGNKTEAILKRGSVEAISTVSEEAATGIAPVGMGPVEMGPVEIGITLESLLSFPLLDVGAYDSRNAFSGYVRGDISTISSFNIELGLRYDLLNPQAWPRYAFTTPGEGQYIVYSEEGNVDSRGQENFAFNFLTEPELTVSLLNENLQLRWGMFRRDWGSGVGNLIISSTARSFDAVEGKLALTDWLTYQYLTGTLTAPKILASVGGYGRPDQYQNMLTTKRLQFDLPHRISFSVFETVMWPKRFELGYLNPFMISTIYQNTLGDYDNMFAGFDFSLGFFDTGEIYGSFMIDETQSVNPLTWFTDPRTIFGLQAGIKSRIPFLPLATAVFQYTRLEPFFYTHRPLSHPSLDSQVLVEIKDEATFNTLVADGYENLFVARDGDGKSKYYLIVTKQVDLSYTNKLENLGYYLKPASDECKLIVDTFFPPSWFTRFSLSYIRHADQYGSEINDYMNYVIDQAGGYEDKAFTDHLVEHTLTASLAVEHQLEHAPLRVKASYAYTHSWLKDESADADWGESGSHLFSFGIALYR